MTVLSGQTIRELCQRQATNSWSALGIHPFSECKQALGMSYGLSVAGYDIRVGSIQSASRGHETIRNGWQLIMPGGFLLMASLEKVSLPPSIIGFVHDKSTLARQGLALQNTVLEPGWSGHITLELSNHSVKAVRILIGQPIAQLVFHFLDRPAEEPYNGKYQNQGRDPVEAIRDPDAEQL